MCVQMAISCLIRTGTWTIQELVAACVSADASKFLLWPESEYGAGIDRGYAIDSIDVTHNDCLVKAFFDLHQHGTSMKLATLSQLL